MRTSINHLQYYATAYHFKYHTTANNFDYHPRANDPTSGLR